ncbi:hypothetical protein Ddye_014042 [Dipteronia dyeriana]|uniref:RNase H type-1 domain-containing protein n=1 Tax=Dipteronia dyeriana TaxID=168575 RepID=A0AAD9X7P8_9ROSI|nr:hypothetical protein Ddye_014042 [Dipteronia dyeriana]
MAFLKEFHRDGYVVRDLNSTFIALIVKVKNLVLVSDFRPIKLVDSIQNFGQGSSQWSKKGDELGHWGLPDAFVIGRQITDSFVVAEKIINRWKSEKEGGNESNLSSQFVRAVVSLYKQGSCAEAILKDADSVQLRVAWWFKHHGPGSLDSITTLMRNVSEFCKDPVKQKNCVSEEWIPLGLEAFKFNIDGSSRGNPGDAGIGGVLRNKHGAVFCLFLLQIGAYDAITAELMAIEKACSL